MEWVAFTLNYTRRTQRPLGSPARSTRVTHSGLVIDSGTARSYAQCTVPPYSVRREIGFTAQLHWLGQLHIEHASMAAPHIEHPSTINHLFAHQLTSGPPARHTHHQTHPAERRREKVGSRKVGVERGPSSQVSVPEPASGTPNTPHQNTPPTKTSAPSPDRNSAHQACTSHRVRLGASRPGSTTRGLRYAMSSPAGTKAPGAPGGGTSAPRRMGGVGAHMHDSKVPGGCLA